MKPYKHHEAPNTDIISQKLYQFIQEAGTRTRLEFFNRFDIQEVLPYVPELKQAFDALNVCGKGIVGIIKVDPYEKLYPHVDCFPDAVHLVAVNWPIFNCEDTYTVFYKILVSKYKTMLLDNNELYHYYPYENVEEEYRFKINTPTAIRVDVPHSVINKTLLPRYTASFRFDDPPWHLLDKQK
jgi:hypothetical protein